MLPGQQHLQIKTILLNLCLPSFKDPVVVLLTLLGFFKLQERGVIANKQHLAALLFVLCSQCPCKRISHDKGRRDKIYVYWRVLCVLKKSSG